FSVSWEYPSMEADLMIPQAYLDGKLLGIALYDLDNEILVPLNPVKELIDAKMEWIANENIMLFYDTHGVAARQIGDLIYVPEWVIRWLMPGADLTIKYPE